MTENSGATAVSIGWCTSIDSINAEILGASGADMVCVDGQHGVKGWGELLAVVHLLTAAGTTTLVRVPRLDPEAIGHALDSGAHGVIVPFVESKADALAAVSACRYPPAGSRSWGPNRAAAFRSDRSVLADPLCVVMLETAGAISQAEEIAGVDGVSAVLVGARDLAMTLGLDPMGKDLLVTSAEMLELITSVASACRRHSVPAAAPVSTSEQTKHLISLGYSWFVLPSDIQLLQAAMRSSMAQLLDPGQS
jgi:4-hydroxy-2-oxoheptanedioate aldolase